MYCPIFLQFSLLIELLCKLLICIEFPSKVHVELLSVFCCSLHQPFVQHRLFLQCFGTCSMFGIFTVWDLLLLSRLLHSWMFLCPSQAIVPFPLHALVYLFPSTSLSFMHSPASFAFFQGRKQLVLSSIVRCDTWDPILRRPSSLPIARFHLSLRARWSFACTFHCRMKKRIAIHVFHLRLCPVRPPIGTRKDKSAKCGSRRMLEEGVVEPIQ